MQEGVGGIKHTEETYVREESREEEAVSHVVGGLLRSIGTGRGLQRKGLLRHTALVARHARRNKTGIAAKSTAVSHRVGGSLRS